MKRTAFFVIIALLVMQMLPAVPVQAEPLEASDIQTTNLYNGFTISWITNEKSTGWVRYGVDNPDAGSFLRADDSRGSDVESHTHMVQEILGYEYQGSTVYFDVYGGDNVRLTSGGSLSVTLPIAPDFPEPNIMLGSVTDGTNGIGGALVYINITRGTETTLSMVNMTTSSGHFVMNTGNGILFHDVGNEYDIYAPVVGDVMNVWVNTAYGELTYAEIVTSTDVQGPYIEFDPIVLSIPFMLSDVLVSPTEGGPDTAFTFSVTYTATDGQEPDHIWLYLDGVEYEMTAQGTGYVSGVEYTYSVTGLAAGNHSYYAMVERDGISISTSPSPQDAPVIVISAPAAAPDDDDGLDPILLAGVGFLVLAAVLIAVLVMKRGAHGGGEEKKEEEEEGKDGEE
ncbi:MAG: hypothetical protein KAT70_02035 [Thermoplasmata archaeon]|nr:hypothetical protein [Thermoplasmata archaeon]